MSNDNTMMHRIATQGSIPAIDPNQRQELVAMLCAVLGLAPDELAALARTGDRCTKLETECDRLRAKLAEGCSGDCSTKVSERCDNIWNVARRACCPGNLLYSRITLDEFSDNRQVSLGTIVQNFGAGFVNAFPVAPGEAIRLEQPARPGYHPDKIAIDFSLAGGASNYLDIEIAFFLGPGGTTKGKQIGPVWTGNEFLNKDGTQIWIDMPKYRGMIVEVGSIEKMAVEIRHTGGANNLISTKVRLPYDEEAWYKHCGTLGC